MPLKKYLLYFILVYFLCQNLTAQNKNKEQLLVSNTLKSLFNGMRAGDSAIVHKAFHKNIRMYSSYKNIKGHDVLKEGDLNEFLKAIGTPHDLIWDERLSNMIIQIDGNLSQVWVDYMFYLGDQFSHCGVNALQLLRNKDGIWKIINLIDTRRKELNKCNL